MDLLTESKNLRLVSFRSIDNNIPGHPDRYQLDPIYNLASPGSPIFKAALERGSGPERKNRLKLDLKSYSGLRDDARGEVEEYEHGEENIGGRPWDGEIWHDIRKMVFGYYMEFGMPPGKTLEDFVALMVTDDQGAFFPDLQEACVHDPWATTVDNKSARDRIEEWRDYELARLAQKMAYDRAFDEMIPGGVE